MPSALAVGMQLSTTWGEEYRQIASKFQQDSDLVHHGITAAIRAILDSRPAEYTRRYVIEAARLRRFLS